MRDELQALHSQLLELKPDGVVHEADSCPLCAMESIETPETTPGGEPVADPQNVDVEAEIAKAVEAATAPLKAKVAELEQVTQESELGQAVAAATAPLTETISELQTALDEANVRSAAADSAKAELETYWAEAIAAHEAAEAVEGRKAERVEQAKAAGVLTDEYVDSNADRFAAMSDEDFTARLGEWQEIASAASETKIPVTTGFTAARETAAASDNNGSALSLMRKLQRGSNDPRSL